MKRKTLAKAMVVLMGALCTVPAYSAPKASDFVINCKLVMKNSSGTLFYVRSTASTTTSGQLVLTSDSSKATKFAFLRRETFDDTTAGTQYIPVPRGNCMGYVNTTFGVVDKAPVEVVNCNNIAKTSWLLDNRPTSLLLSGFVMKYRFDPHMHLNAKPVASGTVLRVIDTTINTVASTDITFSTSGCTHANNSKLKPRGGT
jgi:hypothetical protein